jgi:hypothetical protein
VNPTVAGKLKRLLFVGFLIFARCVWGGESAEQTAPPQTNYCGLMTNKSAIFQATVITYPRVAPPLRTNSNGTILRRPVPRTPLTGTNLVFERFLPESLNHYVLTNVCGRTNRRVTTIWPERTHPSGWPKKPPVVRWETNNLMWGMTGLTALSPCWQGEGSPGQVPVTALTRRHGYTRGHSLGDPGFHKNFVNFRVWFLTLRNEVVEVRVLREVVRCGHEGDYTILLFDRDLPPSIQPLRVVSAPTLQVKYPGFQVTVPRPMLLTEQAGNVSACISGFTVPTFKGGDSGSPNLLPLGNELIFTGGRSTSGASARMQSDMDELCRLAGLKPESYQMKWESLEAFPSY